MERNWVEKGVRVRDTTVALQEQKGKEKQNKMVECQ